MAHVTPAVPTHTGSPRMKAMNSSPVHKLSTGPSLADQAYAALREGITSGRFAPGQTLTERALAGDLGVSPTPVREPISRLEHARLLQRDEHALTFAAPGLVLHHDV